MANLDENLRTFVLADSSIAAKIADRMHFNKAPQTSLFPRIVFTRTGAMREGCLDDAVGSAAATDEAFLLDVQAVNREDAEDIRKLLETRLEAYRGTFGDTTALGVFVGEQSSRFEPRGTGQDDGLHFASMAVEVIVA